MRGSKEIILRSIERILYRDKVEDYYVLEEDWDVLIILDACRYDAFAICSKLLNAKGKLEYRISLASHTSEFIRKHFLNSHSIAFLKDIVYVSANPMVDAALGKYRKYFYKYIPIWSFAWNERLVTVPPWETAYYALKTYIKTIPNNKRMIVHFLQPHGPFIGPIYGHISKCFSKEIKNFIKKYIVSATRDSCNKRCKSTMLALLNHYVKPLVKEGMLNGFLGLNKCFTLEDLVKAYIENLLITLPYVDQLLHTFSGKIVVTSDHGEAFGEYLHELIPIRVIGHFSGIHINALVKVPWYIVENSIDYKEALRRALKGALRLRLRMIKERQGE